MKERYLSHAVRHACFAANKMALLSGPRQCGKTTFAKMQLAARGAGAYGNWDEPVFRRAWTKDPAGWTRAAQERAGDARALLVLDQLDRLVRWGGFPEPVLQAATRSRACGGAAEPRKSFAKTCAICRASRSSRASRC